MCVGGRGGEYVEGESWSYLCGTPGYFWRHGSLHAGLGRGNLEALKAIVGGLLLSFVAAEACGVKFWDDVGIVVPLGSVCI